MNFIAARKMTVILASCAFCAIASAQPMPPPHEGDRMDTHELEHPMAHPEAPPPHHHQHKVWVPARHDEHGHMVAGHYVYR